MTIFSPRFAAAFVHSTEASIQVNKGGREMIRKQSAKPVWRAIAASAALVCGLTTSSKGNAETELILNGWAGATQQLTKDILVGWAKEVEKASGGRIKYRLLPKAPAAPAGTLDAVMEGLCDVSYISHGLHPGRFSLTKVVEFPQAGSTAEINSVVYQRLYEKHLAKAGEHKGVKVINVFTHGPGHIFTTAKRQVLKPADLEGLKLRVGGPALGELMHALGATPVIRGAPEMYELLSNSVVDGTLVPFSPVVTFKTERILRYGTSIPGGLYTLSFALIMSEKTFNAMPKQDQDVINAWSGERWASRSGQAWDVEDQDGIAALKKAGVQLAMADPSLVAAIREKAKPIEQAWFREARQKGIDGEKVLNEFREETRKMAAKR
jgi:TRAP-type C4-dicarboxylate transport system substrate-binding protein